MAENGSCVGSSSPLSEQDFDVIRTTWKYIWLDKKNSGREFFIKFFQHNPTSIETFRDFKGMTIGEVAVQKKLTAHGISVLYAIKSLVDNLEDLDTLTHLIRKNARNHAERGISGADYKWLMPAFSDLLADKMHGNVTSEQKNAWTKVFDVMTAIQEEECSKIQGNIVD